MRNHILLPMLFLGVLGCASLPAGLSIQAPTVQLDRVRITGLGFSGGALALDLGIENPNRFGLTTSRLEAEVDLEETHFGDIALERGIRLEPESRQTVEVPVTFTWAGLGAGARGMLEAGSVDYGITVRLFVESPLGTRTFTVRQDGVVPIEALIR